MAQDVKVDFGKLQPTKLGWGQRECGKKKRARSQVLGMDVSICSSDEERINSTTGGMTLSGIGGTDMARKAKKCKFGKVKSGPRKGLCRKQRRRSR
jgi:hypothetical protein